MVQDKKKYRMNISLLTDVAHQLHVQRHRRWPWM